MSLETLGLEKDLSTPISFSRDSSVAPRMAVHVVLVGIVSIGFGRREWLTSMPQISYAAVDQTGVNDLISFLKAIPDGRYLQWFLLLVAVLGILSGCRRSRDLDAFTRRHRQVLNQALGLDFKRWLSDATFLYLFNKAHLQTFGDVFQAWMISQIPGGAEGLEQLVCDGKTLRGSAVVTEDGGRRFATQVTVFTPGLIQSLSQALLSVLSAWVEVGGIAPPCA